MAQKEATLMTMGASGGRSDDAFMGIDNSFQHIENLEIRKNPKQVQLNYALVKDSGSVVVDKINCALTVSSTGDIVAFGDAGNIYIKSSGGSWKKVYTHASGYAILGCIEYNQYVYRATLDKLHRTDLTSIATAISSGTLTPTDLDWKTLNGITYSNGLRSSYVTDAATTQKVGMKIYAKKNYTLTDVGVSDGTNAATKGYLYKYYEPAAIAGNSLRLYTSSDIDPATGAATWTERRPNGDANWNWNTVAVSRDGLKMAAGIEGDDLYISTDGGVNRTAPTISGTGTYVDGHGVASTNTNNDDDWRGFRFTTKSACKLTAVKLFAGCSDATVRILSSGGATLASATASSGVATFSLDLTDATIYRVELGINDSASLLQRYVTGFAYPAEQSLYTMNSFSYNGSDNSGETIYNIESMTFEAGHNFSDLGMSDSGATILGSQRKFRLYKSTDTGSTWAETQPAGNVDKKRKTIAVSGNGTSFLTGVYPGRLYSTSDGGTNRVEEQPAGNADKNWNCSWLNYEGTIAIAGAYGTRLRKSVDSMANWTELRPAGNADKNRVGCCASNDGRYIYAATDTDFYYSSDSGATWGTNAMTTAAISAINCNYLGNIVTLTDAKRCWQSIDGGVTFTELRPVGDVDKTRNNLKISTGAELLETVDVTANVATFSTTLSVGSYYYILFDKEGSTRDPSYKTTDLPVTKTDINYVAGVTPILTTTTGYVITSIGTAQVQDVAHPMITSNGTLYIGDGQYVATIDPVGAYVGDTLTLAEMDKIHDITYNNAYVRIYCINGTNNDVGIAYFWDGVQEAPDQRQELPGKFRNVAMKDNIDYAIMGTAEPILYYYPYQRQVLKRIENLSSGVKSMCLYKNYLLFGCKGGVYSWGNFNKDYPEALNLERKTSNANDTDDIGCIWNSNGELYVAWKNDTTYGIDKLSTTTYNTTGYFTTKVYYGNLMWKRKDTAEIYIAHKPLTTGESIQVYTRENLSGSYTLKYTIDTTNGTGAHNSFLLQEERNELETKVVLNGPGASTPEVYELILRHNEEDHG